MQKKRSLYHGHRFPAVVISQAVRWYFRFQLSLRDIEELLFEGGVVAATRRSGAGATTSSRALRMVPRVHAASRDRLASGRDVRDAARGTLSAVARRRST